MNIDRYIELRNCYKEFVYRVLEHENATDKLIKRAAKVLDLLHEDTLVFDSEVESDVLMDYMIYEKNGMGNCIVERFDNLNLELSKNERILLDGMLNNLF